MARHTEVERERQVDERPLAPREDASSSRDDSEEDVSPDQPLRELQVDEQPTDRERERRRQEMTEALDDER